jgi:hypothetical protein
LCVFFKFYFSVDVLGPRGRIERAGQAVKATPPESQGSLGTFENPKDKKQNSCG